MSRPRCLVVCSIGPNAIVDFWLSPLPDMDYALIDYSGLEREAPEGVRFFRKASGYKIPNFVALSQQHPEVFDYDYYLFLDDDLEITPETLQSLFRQTAEAGVDLAQPSLTSDSVTNFEFLQNRPGIHSERVSFVEIQCFCMSRRLLAAVWPFWHMAQSGTFLDIAQSRICLEKYGRNSMALWHNLQIRHPHRTETQKIRGNASFQSLVALLSPQFGFALTQHAQHQLIGDIQFEIFDQRREKALTFKQQLRLIHDFLWRIGQKVSQKLGLCCLRAAGKNLALRLKRLFGSSWFGLNAKPLPAFGFSKNEGLCLFGALTPQARVLEYGSGKSTIDIARCVSHIVSIEHNPDWYERLVPDCPDNVSLVLAPSCADHNPLWLKGGDNWRELDFCGALPKDGTPELFSDYIQAQSRVNPTMEPYDIILIDGRARVFCAEYVYQQNLLKDDGLLFVHDFERPLYHAVELWFERVQVVDRLGVFRKRRLAN